MAEEEKNKVWAIIESINSLWTGGQVEHVGAFYDNNVIQVDPEYKTLSTSREELVKSFKSFCDNARVNSFSESDQKIDIFGTTAIVIYSWSIQYLMNAKTYDETGKEILILSKDTGEWLIVWRMLIPDKQNQS